MQFWPFKKNPPLTPLSPEELRDALIAAARVSSRQLLTICKQRKNEIAPQVDFLRKIPAEIRTDPAKCNEYVPCLIAAAECLAHRCGVPELLNKLMVSDADNPITKWNDWRAALPQRMENLEYDALLSEAQALITQAKTFQGPTAPTHVAMLTGSLGQLYFHSGEMALAREQFEAALAICEQSGDVEGQSAYLGSLLEVHAYLDDGKAVEFAQQLQEVKRQRGESTNQIDRRLQLLQKGTPLCRVVCVHNGLESELEELTGAGDGRYQFQFRRNRLSLKKSTTLTAQGNQFASSGEFAAALEKYNEASEVDPHDPDPVYQSALCLLELGAFAKARESYEAVERLAPAWFNCRSDRWIAEGLESGAISVEEFQLLRVLQDGGLEPAEALKLVQQGLARFPDFAPLKMIEGDLYRDRRETAKAIAAYRRGLELVEEPELESRLLCALAGLLPATDPERKTLVDRAINLKGSLVAHATTKLMSIQ